MGRSSFRVFLFRIAEMLLLGIFLVGALVVQAGPPLAYTLTIYVDEGRGSPSGHVFVALSDGKNLIFRGFYPKEARTDTFGKVISPIGAAGGEVRDDRTHRWDVRKTFPITKEGFERAIAATESGRGKTWCLLNHCGDFALGVATAAGVKLDLPATLTGMDRPGLFGAHLRANGGVTFKDVQDCRERYKARGEELKVQLIDCAACQGNRAHQQQNLAGLEAKIKELQAECEINPSSRR